MLSTKFITTFIMGLLMASAVIAQEAQPQPTQIPEQPQQPATAQIEPKKEGVIRIGVVIAKTQMKQDGTGQDTAEIVRTRWYSFLGGPAVELIPIESRVPIQINVEAGQKGCDYVLYSAVSQKTKGSIFGKFIKVAVPILANSIPVGPGVAGGSIAEGIKNSVKEGAKDAAKNMAIEAAGKIKAKDQVTLEFVLVKPNVSEPMITRVSKAKAAIDGEDIISPLIEQAANEILGVAMKG